MNEPCTSDEVEKLDAARRMQSMPCPMPRPSEKRKNKKYISCMDELPPARTEGDSFDSSRLRAAKDSPWLTDDGSALSELYAKQNIVPDDEDVASELEEAVINQLDAYFRSLGDGKPHPLYEMVVGAVERPLIIYALEKAKHRQLGASTLLGINRNTLTRKMSVHGISRKDSLVRK